jgi:hypothetical protein
LNLFVQIPHLPLVRSGSGAFLFRLLVVSPFGALVSLQRRSM